MIPAKSRMTHGLEAADGDGSRRLRPAALRRDRTHHQEREEHENDRQDEEREQAHREAAPEPQRTAHPALLAGKGSAPPRSGGGPDDGVGEHDVREPDAEVGHHDPPGGRGVPGEDGLAEHAVGSG